MINPLTLYSKIQQLQLDVLGPLYIDHTNQMKTHDELLRFTGKSIEPWKGFIEDVFNSTFVKLAFKVVKALGFADQLTKEDFQRFTNYVNDGGLDAMLNMLKCVDMEKAFMEELAMLPPEIQLNAPIMLEKARVLHQDYILGYLQKKYGPAKFIPSILLRRQRETDEFIEKLAKLAHKNNQIDEVVDQILKA